MGRIVFDTRIEIIGTHQKWGQEGSKRGRRRREETHA
jgi:hypothetical protein